MPLTDKLLKDYEKDPEYLAQHLAYQLAEEMHRALLTTGQQPAGKLLQRVQQNDDNITLLDLARCAVATGRSFTLFVPATNTELREHAHSSETTPLTKEGAYAILRTMGMAKSIHWTGMTCYAEWQNRLTVTAGGLGTAVQSITLEGGPLLGRKVYKSFPPTTKGLWDACAMAARLAEEEGVQ